MRRKDDEKQNAIKKAVIKIVLEQGMHGASISKIAKAAGVSPATVYVYYENKDIMLRDIYYDYSNEIFASLVKTTSAEMKADAFIDAIIREYYRLMVQKEEIYHFVEQFSSCPSLNQGCNAIKDLDELNACIVAYKTQGSLIDYDNSNIWAMIFYPVKGIAKKSCTDQISKEERLDEMIQIIQRALLK